MNQFKITSETYGFSVVRWTTGLESKMSCWRPGWREWASMGWVL